MNNQKSYVKGRSKNQLSTRDQAKKDFATAVKTFGHDYLKKEDPEYNHDHIAEFEKENSLAKINSNDGLNLIVK